LILRDPVHGLIAFDSAEEQIVIKLLATAEVQRLRRIRQLGVASLAFPGAEHTRFAHALGTAHVMKRLIARLRDVDTDLPSWQKLTFSHAREALAAALLHDLGHGPFSHLFEEAIPRVGEHERWSSRILLDRTTEVGRVLAAEDPELPSRVAQLIHGHHELVYLARAVSGTLDVDRCDYLLRDAHGTGVPYGRYDLDWLLRSLRFAPLDGERTSPPLAIDGAKGIVSIESFVMARLFMFQQVYFHKAARAGEWMIRAIMSRAAALLADGKKLPMVPPAIQTAASGCEVALWDYLELDDNVLFGAMHAWEKGPDPILADLTRRVRARALFKTLELYGNAPVRADDALATAREIAVRAGLAPDAYVGLDTAVDVPFSDREDPLAVVFPGGVTRKPGDVSFLLGRLRDETVTRSRLIFAPELRAQIVVALGA
jgi:uncharacterized protein